MVTYCPNCGRQTPHDAMICPYCRQNISQNKISTGTQYPLHQMQPPQKDNTKLIIIIAVVIIAVILATVAIAATMYVYVGGMMGPEPSYGTPDISFVKDEAGDTLMVAYAAPTTVTWGEIEITGNCDTTGLTGKITVGQKITNCDGTITIIYPPTNSLLGSWTFNSN